MIHIFSSYKKLHLETKRAELVHPEMPGVGVAGSIMKMIAKCVCSSKFRSASVCELSVSLQINCRCNITNRLSSGSKNISASNELGFFFLVFLFKSGYEHVWPLVKTNVTHSERVFSHTETFFSTFEALG